MPTSTLLKVAFDRAYEVLQTARALPAKRAAESVRGVAEEARATQDPSPLIPELSDKCEEAAGALSELAPTRKKGVPETIEPIIGWVNEQRTALASNDVAANRIEEITREIKALSSHAATALIRIGGLLTEAKEEYAGPTAKGFIEWAESEFGFKKAYTYRLMKVHANFGRDPVLSRIPVSVLSMLSGQSEDKLQEARKLAEKGQLDHTSVKALTQSDRNRPNKEEVESPAGTRKGEYQSKEELDPLNAKVPEAPDHSDDDSRETIDSLTELVRSLRLELQAAREEAAKSRGKRSENKMPMLPQFKSSSYCARLGLDATEGGNPTRIREAFRELVAVGYGRGHEAFELLEEARKHLTDKAQAA